MRHAGLIAALIALAGLAGCGADGEPEQPTREAQITLSDAGLSGAARASVRQGPVTLSVGLGL